MAEIEIPPTPVGPPGPSAYTLYGLFIDGVVKGFWDDRLYPPKTNGDRNDKIPPEAVVLTEAQHQELVSNQDARYVDGEIIPAVRLGATTQDWGPTVTDALGGRYY